jgi:hypothetical protein
MDNDIDDPRGEGLYVGVVDCAASTVGAIDTMGCTFVASSDASSGDLSVFVGLAKRSVGDILDTAEEGWCEAHVGGLLIVGKELGPLVKLCDDKPFAVDDGNGDGFNSSIGKLSDLNSRHSTSGTTIAEIATKNNFILGRGTLTICCYYDPDGT